MTRCISAAGLLCLVLCGVVAPGQSSSASTHADECCLCNDCDMMMMTKPEATVYDLDENKLIGCSEFAELVFMNVKGSADSCLEIQRIYQSSCCSNSGNNNNNSLDKEETKGSVANHRELQISIPFSRRELQWYAPFNTANAQTSYNPSSSSSMWGLANTQVVSTATNTNGNALGCYVPGDKTLKVVQVYSMTASGFSSPNNVGCGPASHSGLPMSTSDNMYSLALKCVRCNCCENDCTGVDANVCIGNNQPRQGSSTGGWTATSVASTQGGWRHRLLEFLDME